MGKLAISLLPPAPSNVPSSPAPALTVLRMTLKKAPSPSTSRGMFFSHFSPSQIGVHGLKRRYQPVAVGTHVGKNLL